MIPILQYAPWCRLYIVTERPWEGKKQTEGSISPGMKRLMRYEDQGVDIEKTLTEDQGARKLYDVTNDIITGNVGLTVNAMHSLNFTLANPRGKYVNLFLPNDRIVLFLRRIRPIQVFTGLLNRVPAATSRKDEEVQFTASCQIKRLSNQFWDPYLVFHQEKLWRQTPEFILHYLVEEVGKWNPKDVYIQPMKDTEFWNQLSSIGISISGMGGAVAENLGIGSGATPGGTDLTNGNAIDAQNLDNYLFGKNAAFAGHGQEFVAAGKKYNVNPALPVAIGGHESAWGRQGVVTNHPYNAWGRKASGGGWMTFNNWAEAIENETSYLTQYLTPGGKFYRDGTIHGIGMIYCEDADRPGGWIDTITKLFQEIMTNCGSPQATSGSTLNTERLDALDRRSPTTGNTTEDQTPSEGRENKGSLWDRLAGLDGASDGTATVTDENVDPNAPSNAASQSKRNVIVAEAYAQIGKPYNVGSTGPDAFDCSNFVKWCYAKAGLDMPAPTWSAVDHMKSMNTYIDYSNTDPAQAIQDFLSKAQPADVIEWYGSRGLNPPDHTGIYVGNGKMVHAGNPVKEQSVEEYHNWQVSKRGKGIWGLGTHKEIGGNYVGDPSGAGGDNTLGVMNWQGFTLDQRAELYTGLYQLAVSDRLLPSILEVGKWGMYNINSDGTGRFIARWVDYFGEEPDASGRKGPHFRIEPIEIVRGNIYITDDNLVTHQFVIGDVVQNGSIGLEDWLQMNDDGNPQVGIAAFDMPRMGIMNATEWTAEDFIRRFGFRPGIDQMMICINMAQVQFMAEYLFRYKWANNVIGSIETTFLPEVRPMMIVSIPMWEMQFFVESVSHTFGPQFGTTITLKAGMFTGERFGSRNPLLMKVESDPEATDIDAIQDKLSKMGKDVFTNIFSRSFSFFDNPAMRLFREKLPVVR